MFKQKCNRCSYEQYIPTHQYIKFENRRYELCTPCWDVFNNWLYGTALHQAKPNPGKIYSSGLVTGKEPSEELITGREPGKKITLKSEFMKGFKKWFQASTKEGLEKIIE